MTDWWGDSAAWASAVGTIAATVTAHYVATRSWPMAAAERANRDAIQARRMVIQSDGEASFKVTNFNCKYV